MADLKVEATGKKAEPKVKQTDTGNLSILDSITKPVKDKLDQVDKSINPFRKVADQLSSGGKK